MSRVPPRRRDGWTQTGPCLRPGLRQSSSSSRVSLSYYTGRCRHRDIAHWPQECGQLIGRFCWPKKAMLAMQRPRLGQGDARTVGSCEKEKGRPGGGGGPAGSRRGNETTGGGLDDTRSELHFCPNLQTPAIRWNPEYTAVNSLTGPQGTTHSTGKAAPKRLTCVFPHSAQARLRRPLAINAAEAPAACRVRHTPVWVLVPSAGKGRPRPAGPQRVLSRATVALCVC